MAEGMRSLFAVKEGMKLTRREAAGLAGFSSSRFVFTFLSEGLGGCLLVSGGVGVEVGWMCEGLEAARCTLTPGSSTRERRDGLSLHSELHRYKQFAVGLLECAYIYLF